MFQPTTCISHVIGHEGPGSLLSALKARSWCNSLIIGTRSDHRGFDFMYINVDLTESGIDNVDNIIQLLFQVLLFVILFFRFTHLTKLTFTPKISLQL